MHEETAYPQYVLDHMLKQIREEFAGHSAEQDQRAK